MPCLFPTSVSSPRELEDAELYHQELLEAAADCDDDLMEKVLMEEEVSVEELKAAIRKGTIACKLHPRWTKSSLKKASPVSKLAERNLLMRAGIGAKTMATLS